MKINIKGKIDYVSELVRTYNNWYLILLDRLLGINPRRLYLKNGLVIVGCANSKIADLVHEIFIERVYNPQSFEVKRGDVVVDIGANIGVFGLYAALNGASKVFSIEPLSANTVLIKRNFALNKFKPSEIIKTAISDKNGQAKLYIGDIDSHNLLFDHNHERIFNKSVLVETTKLEALFDNWKVKKIDFLKVDCEGSEGQLLLSTPVKVWRNVKRISIEYHNDVSVLKDNKIIEILKTFGYKTKQLKSDDLFGYIYAWR